jgi:hypothetical protein
MDGIAGICPAETLSHVLLRCPVYAKPRAAAVRQLCTLATDPAACAIATGASAQVPSFSGTHAETALFVAFRLCMGVGPAPLPSHRPAPPPCIGAANAPGTLEELAAKATLASPDFVYHHQTAVETAAWVTVLMREWDDRVSTEYNVVMCPSPGFVLARAMTTYVATVFRLRRCRLQEAADFFIADARRTSAGPCGERTTT